MEIFTQKPSANVIKVGLVGDLDAESCAMVRPAFSDLLAIDGLSEVRLNLAGVKFLDSSGVGAIVFLWKRLNSVGNKLVLEEPAGQPAQLLSMLRIDKSIRVEAAVA